MQQHNALPVEIVRGRGNFYTPLAVQNEKLRRYSPCHRTLHTAVGFPKLPETHYAAKEKDLDHATKLALGDSAPLRVF